MTASVLAALAAPSRLDVVTPEVVAESRRMLGRVLAESRRSARVTQDRLAVLVRWSRSTIANVEVGRQFALREFWVACGVALGLEGDAIGGVGPHGRLGAPASVAGGRGADSAAPRPAIPRVHVP